ncbi:MAG TPA: hypothetical protein VKR27_04365 [Acidimicrobiales bacterium]|nr:hypothetical protein [Acidimicrobiales bacterium]
MLECVVNISEGRNEEILASFASLASRALIDLHSDPAHNRSVFTLAGDAVAGASRALTKDVISRLDIRAHTGVHPRIGVVDVVPFVPIGDELKPEGNLEEAIAARDEFARWAGEEVGLPCFLYGPERSLPDVRRQAFAELQPDFGPDHPHETAGACCVGARRALVAYNVILDIDDLALARSIATAIRSPAVRALGFGVGDEAQVSCNLIAPWAVGPADVYDEIADRAPIRRGELVGLVPASVLDAIAKERWPILGLRDEATIEARVAALDRKGVG